MNNIRKPFALVAMLALVVAACGDDDDTGSADDPGRQDLVAAMTSEGASEDEANCFIDELGLDDAERIFGADEADLSEDDMGRALAAFEECSEEGMAPDSDTEDGGEENADVGASDESSDEPSTDESASGDLTDVRSCLEDGGLTVGESSAPEELNESLGITDSVTVVSNSGGAGVVTLYEDGDLATEAREYESSTEGDIDGVTIGQVNELVYSYSGDSGGLSVLEDCVF